LARRALSRGLCLSARAPSGAVRGQDPAMTRALKPLTASSTPYCRQSVSRSADAPSCCASPSLLPSRTRRGDSRFSAHRSIEYQTFAPCVPAARPASIRARGRWRVMLGTDRRSPLPRRNSRRSCALCREPRRCRGTVHRVPPVRRPSSRRPPRVRRRRPLLRPSAAPPRMTSGRVAPLFVPSTLVFRKERSDRPHRGGRNDEPTPTSCTRDRAMIEVPALIFACRMYATNRNP
jgi:hypothetical protein